jgi:hypothetical protein
VYKRALGLAGTRRERKIASVQEGMGKERMRECVTCSTSLSYSALMSSEDTVRLCTYVVICYVMLCCIMYVCYVVFRRHRGVMHLLWYAMSYCVMLVNVTLCCDIVHGVML